MMVTHFGGDHAKAAHEASNTCGAHARLFFGKAL